MPDLSWHLLNRECIVQRLRDSIFRNAEKQDSKQKKPHNDLRPAPTSRKTQEVGHPSFHLASIKSKEVLYVPIRYVGHPSFVGQPLVL